MKEFHATEEDSSYPKSIQHLQNIKFCYSNFFFCGSFMPSWIRIRFPLNPDEDPKLQTNKCFLFSSSCCGYCTILTSPVGVQELWYRVVWQTEGPKHHRFRKGGATVKYPKIRPLWSVFQALYPRGENCFIVQNTSQLHYGIDSVWS